MNLWPPYLAAGIRVREISPDYRFARVEMRLRWFNRNYVGVHFGGSLFAMADPFYMLMYMENLGRDYIVWDTAGAIDFVRPGCGTVSVEFSLSQDDIDRAVAGAADGRPYLARHEAQVLSGAGETVSSVQRTIYVRRKPGSDPEQSR